nr:HD domain-containing protein [Hydrogeniiclostridium mannosilyticum]
MENQESRLKQQLRFAIEVDKMKNILRRTVLMDESRRETDAEHSWHFAMIAMLFLSMRARGSTRNVFSRWPWCMIWWKFMPEILSLLTSRPM